MTTKTAALPRGHQASALTPFGDWLHRHRRIFDVAGIVVISVAALSVVTQMLYPTDRALPGLFIGGLDVGGKDGQTIVAQLQEYAEKGEVTIASPSKQWQASWQEIGLAVDTEATTEVALSYLWWERLIPFSSVIRVAQSHDQPLVAIVDSDQLGAFAEQLVQEDKQAARDAMIRVTNGVVVIDPAAEGYVFKPENVKSQVQALAMSEGATLHLVPETIPYQRPGTELTQLKSAAEAMVGRNLVLKLGEKTFQPMPTTVGAWLQFSEDPTTKTMQLTIDREAIQTYLKQIDKDEKFGPGSSTVTLVDGQEIARTPAVGGKTTASETSLSAIEAALRSDQAQPIVNLVTTDVGPNITYVRTYSQTDQGLQAVIQAWKDDYPGTSSVLVRELGNHNRYADIDPDRVYVPASTFKIFVFFAIAQKITAGEITYSTKTDMGWTINDCLEEMIVHSTNPCAISFMNLVGWQRTEDMVREAGFEKTYMNNHGGGDKHTTLRDETNYFLRLYYGRLMAEEPTSRLLGYLKRQVWRAGIPSGVPGVTVANKVGRYDGWLHDVAIVYGEKSHYILGVMTRGYQYSDFAELSRRVYGFFQN